VTQILLASGGGEYTDPWHPFAATSACLKRAFETLGHRVTVTTDVSQHLSQLGGTGPAWDLVVLNLGSAGAPLATDQANVEGLARYASGGGPLLVCHVTAAAFPADEQWETLLGGRWVRGTTMHPPQGEGAIRVLDTEHPVTAGIDDFTVHDERYSYLRVSPDSTVLADQEHDGLRHPVLWARENGAARLLYTALGHDAPSFESPAHQALLANSVRWLLRERPARSNPR
jgi:type 1 glutamine amidotransferase